MNQQISFHGISCENRLLKTNCGQQERNLDENVLQVSKFYHRARNELSASVVF